MKHICIKKNNSGRPFVLYSGFFFNYMYKLNTYINLSDNNDIVISCAFIVKNNKSLLFKTDIKKKEKEIL